MTLFTSHFERATVIVSESRGGRQEDVHHGMCTDVVVQGPVCSFTTAMGTRVVTTRPVWVEKERD